MPELTDFPERKFGIELEMLTPIDRSDLCSICKDALVSAGFNGRRVVSASYSHDNASNTQWKWKTDASCGYELVSPVLSGWAGLDELMTVMEAVDHAGSERSVRLVDRRCGVHVHVDARDLEWSQIKNVAVAMKVWEPLFYAVNPPSRKENQYCSPIAWNAVRMKNANSKEGVQQAWSPNYRTHGNRHSGLNLGAWWNTGSIEFRYFSGTFAFEKAAAAIMLSVLFVEAASKKTTTSARLSEAILQKRFDDLWSMAAAVGFQNYAEKFFRDFLVIRSGGCPAFGALKRFVKERIATFWEDNGQRRDADSTPRRQ